MMHQFPRIAFEVPAPLQKLIQDCWNSSIWTVDRLQVRLQEAIEEAGRTILLHQRPSWGRNYYGLGSNYVLARIRILAYLTSASQVVADAKRGSTRRLLQQTLTSLRRRNLSKR